MPLGNRHAPPFQMNIQADERHYPSKSLYLPNSADLIASENTPSSATGRFLANKSISGQAVFGIDFAASKGRKMWR